MSLELEPRDQTLLAGSEGKAMQLAMRLVVQAARILNAPRLIPISFAHIDACFYTGQSHVDFVRFLLDNGARLAVPAWTNNGVVSLADPELRPEAQAPKMVSEARKLMQLYAELGCRPTWTCAPYQLAGGPRFGDHIAVGESNAVAYYNSVVGARTNKYGDYLDVACAITGKVPFAGLHTDEGRKAQVHFDATALPEAWRASDIFPQLLGHHIGPIAGRRIPAISGLPAATPKDGLKAISAAAAASGGVELWHGVGVTPEAADLASVFAGGETVAVTADALRRAHADLTTARDGPLDAVALGTPHFSFREFAEIVRLLDGRAVKTGLPVLISTSRGVRELIAARGWLAILEGGGVRVPVDVCTYYSPRIPELRGRVMTNAAKWAYYAPGMLGVEVIFGSLRECVESAIRGEVWRDPDLWVMP
ncbi:MAG: aconitase X catalytic domain-containing protein [Rhizobiales bacterium]|nr:aconitase X catalytic domain-containing protein [Hyphomicrobiales bacterium]MBI3672732.1 aconitase X catalytic domain-containing protein [Hyphomicrobiales bacterium]